MADYTRTAVGRVTAAFALMASSSAFNGSVHATSTTENACMTVARNLTVYELPADASVFDCNVAGRMVTYGSTGVRVPGPGMAVSVDALTTDGDSHGFTLEVAADGTVSYHLTDAGGGDTSLAGAHMPGPPSDDADAADNPSPGPSDKVVDATGANTAGAEAADMDELTAIEACRDGAYRTAGHKEYGIYAWYIGDGGMPGGLSRSDAKRAFHDAIANITNSYNNCGYSDTVDARMRFVSETNREAGINSRSQCLDSDGLSVWDAGDLKGNIVAMTCSWAWTMPGVKNDLREADVRFNTRDYDFTNKPTRRCSNKYDIRSIGTHEAGHVFGMSHVGARHENLTMYMNAFTCRKSGRTLGKGDVIALRSLY